MNSSPLAALPTPVSPGMRVGLLGGSFNPAHDGHLRISRHALVQGELDRLWWLVSPGNPLKPDAAMAPLSERVRAARAVCVGGGDRRMAVSDLENTLGTRYTLDTLRVLASHCPGVHFVFVMGSDNLIQLPRWHGWRRLLEEVPLLVAPRPGSALAARRGVVARLLEERIVPPGILADREPPALAFLGGRMDPVSASALRGAALPDAG